MPSSLASTSTHPAPSRAPSCPAPCTLLTQHETPQAAARTCEQRHFPRIPAPICSSLERFLSLNTIEKFGVGPYYMVVCWISTASAIWSLPLTLPCVLPAGFPAAMLDVRLL
eukprot:6204996-Pleurochrysis_carterae.AAC.2